MWVVGLSHIIQSTHGLLPIYGYLLVSDITRFQPDSPTSCTFDHLHEQATRCKKVFATCVLWYHIAPDWPQGYFAFPAVPRGVKSFV